MEWRPTSRDSDVTDGVCPGYWDFLKASQIILMFMVSRYRIIAPNSLECFVLWALEIFATTKIQKCLFSASPYQWDCWNIFLKYQGNFFYFVYSWYKIIFISLWNMPKYSCNLGLVAVEHRAHLLFRALNLETEERHLFAPRFQ